VDNSPTPGDVTRLLQDWKDGGSAEAEARLFELVSRELLHAAEASLRRHPARAHKIDPRELVNEAYLALRKYPVVTTNRGPFFRLMTMAMRHYLLDLVDRERAAKRPPSMMRVAQTDAAESEPAPDSISPVEWYRAIDALRRVDSREADVVELRILGLSNEEIGQELDIAPATVKRELKPRACLPCVPVGYSAPWTDHVTERVHVLVEKRLGAHHKVRSISASNSRMSGGVGA
jgi:RNA polymerase sigma factor (TIGR02999 family)